MKLLKFILFLIPILIFGPKLESKVKWTDASPLQMPIKVNISESHFSNVKYKETGTVWKDDGWDYKKFYIGTNKRLGQENYFGIW